MFMIWSHGPDEFLKSTFVKRACAAASSSSAMMLATMFYTCFRCRYEIVSFLVVPWQPAIWGGKELPLHSQLHLTGR
jgi:hypothetical protein